jgi:hypothetical protein
VSSVCSCVYIALHLRSSATSQLATCSDTAAVPPQLRSTSSAATMLTKCCWFVHMGTVYDAHYYVTTDEPTAICAICCVRGPQSRLWLVSTQLTPCKLLKLLSNSSIRHCCLSSTPLAAVQRVLHCSDCFNARRVKSCWHCLAIAFTLTSSEMTEHVSMRTSVVINLANLLAALHHCTASDCVTTCCCFSYVCWCTHRYSKNGDRAMAGFM